MLNRIISVIGIAIILLIAYLFSDNKRKIRYKPIAMLIGLQFITGFIFLRTDVGLTVLGGIASVFEALLGYAGEGARFVFGGLLDVGGGGIFFFNTLMPIIFISALLGILNYFKILPFIIKYIGIGLSKINGLGVLESYVGAAAMFLGQSEVFISIKNFVHDLSPKRLFYVAAPAMSSVSAGIIGSYMVYLNPSYVLTAIPLNLFGVFVIESMIYPYELEEGEDASQIEVRGEEGSFFAVLAEYIMDGFNTAIAVAAQLIGFIALIAMINGIFSALFGISFQTVVGYLFAPFAFILGIPLEEIVQAGSIIATKLVTNEFVAMVELVDLAISERTMAILSTFLMSFANFSSIGIIIGSVKGINNEQANVIATFSMKLLLGSTLVSGLTAAVIGVVF